MKKSALIKGGFWITAGTFAKRFSALLSNLVLARLLSPADFGIISIAYIFWSLIALFTQASSGLFILYKGIEDKRYLDTVYTINLVISSVLSLGLVLASSSIATFFEEPSLTGILSIYALNLLFSSTYYVYEAILLCKGQYREVTLDNLIAAIVRLLVTVGCALLGLRYWSFAIGDTASWVVNLGLAIWQSKCVLSFKISKSIFSEVANYSIATVGSSLGFYANLNLDNFVVGKLLGSVSLGYYSLAYQLTMSVTKILNPVMDRLGTPMFAKLADDDEQRRSLINVMQKMAFLISPFYALLLLSLDKTVITFLFGTQWVSITNLIPWLVASAYCRSINSPLKAMMAAKGFPNINAKVNLQIAPLAVLSFMIGAHQGGMLGVSIAVAIVLGVVWTVYWWWSACRATHWSLQEFLRPYVLPLSITLGALLISFNLMIGVKQFVFILLYTTLVQFFAPQEFDNYVVLAKTIIKSMHPKDI